MSVNRKEEVVKNQCLNKEYRNQKADCVLNILNASKIDLVEPYYELCSKEISLLEHQRTQPSFYSA